MHNFHKQSKLLINLLLNKKKYYLLLLQRMGCRVKVVQFQALVLHDYQIQNRHKPLKKFKLYFLNYYLIFKY